MGYAKQSCNIAHALDTSCYHRKGQPQAGRAGCRILDFFAETASNSIRVNRGRFMGISATINTQLRSAGHLTHLLM